MQPQIFPARYARGAEARYARARYTSTRGRNRLCELLDNHCSSGLHAYCVALAHFTRRPASLMTCVAGCRIGWLFTKDTPGHHGDSTFTDDSGTSHHGQRRPPTARHPSQDDDLPRSHARACRHCARLEPVRGPPSRLDGARRGRREVSFVRGCGDERQHVLRRLHQGQLCLRWGDGWRRCQPRAVRDVVG